MQRIYKYELLPPDEGNVTSVQMHSGAMALHVDAVGDQLFVWALVPDSLGAFMRERRFIVVGTGHDLDYQGQRYLGTALMHGGALVWHVFEMPAPATIAGYRPELPHEEQL
jgi:hypothetical protein